KSGREELRDGGDFGRVELAIIARCRAVRVFQRRRVDRLIDLTEPVILRKQRGNGIEVIRRGVCVELSLTAHRADDAIEQLARSPRLRRQFRHDTVKFAPLHGSRLYRMSGKKNRDWWRLKWSRGNAPANSTRGCVAPRLTRIL